MVKKVTRKVNLFIVGLPKTGSTSLHSFFEEHPDVFTSYKKELNHFNKDFAEEIISHKGNLPLDYKAKLSDYLKYYEEAKNEKYIADVSPQYSLSKVAAKEILKYNPSAKIIIIFREPISFLFSLHAECLFGLYENEKDFIKAINLIPERKKGKKIPMGAIRPQLLFYEDFIEYKEILKRFLDIFPKNNVKVMLYEDLKSDSSAFFDELLSFLNIRKDINVNMKKKNSRKKIRFKFIARIGKTKSIWLLLNRIMPKVIFEKLRSIYYKIITKKDTQSKLDEQTVKLFKQKYKDKVLDFAGYLCEQDIIEKKELLLKKWNY